MSNKNIKMLMHIQSKIVEQTDIKSPTSSPSPTYSTLNDLCLVRHTSTGAKIQGQKTVVTSCLKLRTGDLWRNRQTLEHRILCQWCRKLRSSLSTNYRLLKRVRKLPI